MLICNLNKIIEKNTACISATIIWEDARKETAQYYYRVDEKHAHLLGNPTDAFLCGALLPALRNGERRIKIDGAVCPYLLDGITEAIYWIKTWYPDIYRNKDISIEVNKLKVSSYKNNGALLFYSGGVDATFSLAHNRELIPFTHPASIKKLILIRGFEIGGKKTEEFDPIVDKQFIQAFEHSKLVSEKYNVELIALSTNIRHLDDRSGLWGEEYVGAALSSCGHALGSTGGVFYLSSAGEPVSETGYLSHFGTHPILDQCYSSYKVRIKHYLANYDSRIERLRIISNHPELLNNLRVCFCPPAEKLNCEVCEKCVRTKLQLELINTLHQSKSFGDKVTKSELENIAISSDSVLQMYLEMAELMRDKGHPLINILEQKIKDYRSYKNWKSGKTWKQTIKKMLSRHLLK